MRFSMYTSCSGHTDYVYKDFFKTCPYRNEIIKGDFYDNPIVVVELETLDELMDFAKRLHDFIMMKKMNGETKFRFYSGLLIDYYDEDDIMTTEYGIKGSIEIYDDYME